MLVSEQLERQLPMLRRYAVAAVGDLSTADECVARALERLIEHVAGGKVGIKDDLDHHMYRLIEEAIQEKTNDRFQSSIWRAILLIELEGVSPEDTARILDLDLLLMRRIISTIRPDAIDGA